MAALRAEAPADHGGRLTRAAHSAHHSHVTEKDVAGFDSLSGAANGRTAQAMRLFCRHGSSSFGRPGGEPQGSPVLHRSVNPFGRPPRLTAMGAVKNRNWSNAMAIAHQGAFAPTLRLASPDQSTQSRRRLAPNVIAMHAEERQPVVQARRRGRLPACIARYGVGRSRLYIGALCALRMPGFPDIPVCLLEIRQSGECVIRAASPRAIPFHDGTHGREAVVSSIYLVRTATIRGDQ